MFGIISNGGRGLTDSYRHYRIEGYGYFNIRFMGILIVSGLGIAGILYLIHCEYWKSNNCKDINEYTDEDQEGKVGDIHSENEVEIRSDNKEEVPSGRDKIDTEEALSNGDKIGTGNDTVEVERVEKIEESEIKELPRVIEPVFPREILERVWKVKVGNEDKMESLQFQDIHLISRLVDYQRELSGGDHPVSLAFHWNKEGLLCEGFDPNEDTKIRDNRNLAMEALRETLTSNDMFLLFFKSNNEEYYALNYSGNRLYIEDSLRDINNTEYRISGMISILRILHPKDANSKHSLNRIIECLSNRFRNAVRDVAEDYLEKYRLLFPIIGTGKNTLDLDPGGRGIFEGTMRRYEEYFSKEYLSLSNEACGDKNSTIFFELKTNKLVEEDTDIVELELLYSEDKSSRNNKEVAGRQLEGIRDNLRIFPDPEDDVSGTNRIVEFLGSSRSFFEGNHDVS